MSNVKVLTTKEVARLCCVSVATVKRWEDKNLIKSERTSGGHRRFRAEEVARFQLDQGLGLKQNPGDESVISAGLRPRENRQLSDSDIFHSLIAGREEEVSNILISEYLNSESLSEIFDEVLAPAMCRIGELWMAGEVTVAQEHLASRAALCGLHRLRSILPLAEPNGKVAMCCTIEGDFHELPTHFMQIALEHEGWEVINFGANMPIYSLAEEVCRNNPQMVCISSSILNNLDYQSREYKNLCEKTAKLKIPVMLGGNGFKDNNVRRRFPADFYPKTFTESIGFIRNIH